MTKRMGKFQRDGGADLSPAATVEALKQHADLAFDVIDANGDGHLSVAALDEIQQGHPQDDLSADMQTKRDKGLQAS